MQYSTTSEIEIRTQSRSGEVSLVSSMNQQFSLFAHLYLVWSHHLVNWFYNFCHLCWIYPSITIHVIHAERIIFINCLTIQFLWSEFLKIYIFKLHTWNKANPIVLTDDLVQVDPICQRGRFVFVWKIECQDLVILNDPELSNYH